MPDPQRSGEPDRVPVAQQLAVRHVDYGVKAEDYESVGASLIRTLEKGLGDGFTPEVKDAWVGAYTVLSGVMIDAAYPAPETAEPTPAPEAPAKPWWKFWA